MQRETRTANPPAGEESIEYLRERESAERSAAAEASDDKARRLHLELAEAYAQRIRNARRTAAAGSAQ